LLLPLSENRILRPIARSPSSYAIEDTGELTILSLRIIAPRFRLQRLHLGTSGHHLADLISPKPGAAPSLTGSWLHCIGSAPVP
jgi:hypothetical protein